MSNPYIPDQLHHMSKKELLEFAQTAHEENVKLVQKLAKANEHITELESELVSRHNHIQELRQEAGEYAVLIAKANERVTELEGDGTRMLHEVANQYDGDDYTDWSVGANHVFKLFGKWLYKNEQLRKEQEK
jgi:chromosome segregation ATPase